MTLVVDRSRAIRAARAFWEFHRGRNEDATRTYELAVGRLTGLRTTPPPPDSDAEPTSAGHGTIPGVGAP